MRFPAEESKLLARLNTISTYGKAKRRKPRLKKDSCMNVLADIFNDDEEDGTGSKLLISKQNKMPPPKKLPKKKKMGFMATSTPINSIIMSSPLKYNAVVAIQSNITNGLSVIQKPKITGKLAAKLRNWQKIENPVEQPQILREENDNYEDDFILSLQDESPKPHEIIDTEKLKPVEPEIQPLISSIRSKAARKPKSTFFKKVATITTPKVAKPKKSTRLIREVSKVPTINELSKNYDNNPSNGESSSKKGNKKSKTNKPNMVKPTIGKPIKVTTGKTIETYSPGQYPTVPVESSKPSKKSRVKKPSKGITIVHDLSTISSVQSKSRIDWSQKYRKTNYTYNELLKMCTKGDDPIDFLSKINRISS